MGDILGNVALRHAAVHDYSTNFDSPMLRYSAAAVLEKKRGPTDRVLLAQCMSVDHISTAFHSYVLVLFQVLELEASAEQLLAESEPLLAAR